MRYHELHDEDDGSNFRNFQKKKYSNRCRRCHEVQKPLIRNILTMLLGRAESIKADSRRRETVTRKREALQLTQSRNPLRNESKASGLTTSQAHMRWVVIQGSTRHSYDTLHSIPTTGTLSTTCLPPRRGNTLQRSGPNERDITSPGAHSVMLI